MRPRAALAAAALVPAALLAHGAGAAPHAPGVSWSCDFEGTYCGMEEQSKVEPGRRSRFVSTARDGRQAVELVTLPGDDQVHGSGDWERDDLELAPSPDYCNEGQEEWWAVSILFPDDYVWKGLGEVMDFHHHADGGQANLNLVAGPQGLRLHGFYGDVKNPREYKAELGRIRRNRWYDFVYHVKWTSRGDGFLTAWLDGRKVLSHRGPTLYPGISCYLKLANYHTPAGRPSSIVFDRVIRGTSARAVARGELER
ncbi:MAG TPA: heparin lyase I family protein [Usitatibacter sp.]|nr:heparin lyase I family protein [Usitatibacter sp.]